MHKVIIDDNKCNRPLFFELVHILNELNNQEEILKLELENEFGDENYAPHLEKKIHLIRNGPPILHGSEFHT
jgi:hypothetical protein